MSAKRYLEIAATAVRKLDLAGIECAALLVTEAIQAGQSLFVFGASHSFMLAEEMVYRTGGLMLVNPIYPQGMNLGVTPLPLTSKLERVVGLGTELLAISPAHPRPAAMRSRLTWRCWRGSEKSKPSASRRARTPAASPAGIPRARSWRTCATSSLTTARRMATRRW